MTSTSVLRFPAAHVLLSGILAAATVMVSSAKAQDFDRITSSLTDTPQTAIDMLPEDVTNVRLGLGPVMAPDYEGSNNYNINPVPVVSLRYRNFLEVDNNEVKITAFNRLFNSNTNMGGGRSLRAGPLVSINFGRSQKANPDLAGMGNVGTAFELGGFVSYTFSPDSRVRLRARQDIASGHNGATVMADYAHTFIRHPQVCLGRQRVRHLGHGPLHALALRRHACASGGFRLSGVHARQRLQGRDLRSERALPHRRAMVGGGQRKLQAPDRGRGRQPDRAHRRHAQPNELQQLLGLFVLGGPRALFAAKCR